MGWAGYMVFDGTEVINASRTEAYVMSQGGEEWFTPGYNADYLRDLLGLPVYTTPDLDLAPWYDQDVPESVDFWGVYPLDATGLDDSSRAPTPVEFTTDGGLPGRTRAAMKNSVWSVALLGANDRAVEYGARWLRRVLSGRLCAPVRADETALGVQMGYLSVQPEAFMVPGGVPVDGDTIFLYGGDAGGIPADTTATVEVALREYMRFLNNSKCSVGPTIERKHAMNGCTGSVWIGQFTILSGDPAPYGRPLQLLQGYLDPLVSNPWPADVPEPGVATTTAHSFTEVNCGEEIWTPIYDPLCSAMITPPAPPSIPFGCYTPPSTWQRRQVTIPSGNIPLWGDMVPVLNVYSAADMRDLRVRWYADPDGTFDPDDNPCSFIGDWLISYVPAGGTLTVDSVSRQIRVQDILGRIRRADSLVFQNDSTPITWPSLSCGYGYVMTVDLPAGQPVPVIDLALVPKATA